jgi:PPOX class probable F420-dependent enzyme
MWLSTVRPDGRLHSVPVWFVWNGADIVILAHPMSRKIRNLRHNPAVVLMLNNTQDGRDVITLEGRATLPTMDEVSAWFPAYGQKYGAQIRTLRAAGLAPGGQQGAGYTRPSSWRLRV